MKKTLTRILMLMLACILSLSLAACGGKENKPAEGEETSIDWTQYPEKFDEWQVANLKQYLREAGVFTKNDWLFDMSSGDLGAIGATAGTMYVDTTGGSITDIIMYFDPANETGAAMLEGLRKDHTLTPAAEGAEAMAMDAMIGNFCMTYTMGSDADHNAALVKAVKDLADHYGITPDFIAE